MKKLGMILIWSLWIILAIIALTLFTPFYIIGRILHWISKAFTYPLNWLGLYGAIVERKLKV